MSLEKLKSVNTSSINLIDKHLELERNKPLPYVPKDGHKPSELGGDCLRRIYYAFFKTPPDQKFKAKTLKIFDTGNYIEDMVLDWLKSVGLHIPYRNEKGEIPVNTFDSKPNPQFPIQIPEWDIPKGFIDNVGVLEKKLWLWEVKSSKGEKFEQLVKPEKSHKRQGGLYLKRFNEDLAAGKYKHIPELEGFSRAEGVRFIYVNKDNSDTIEFILEEEKFTKTFIHLEKKIGKLQAYTKNKELPSKTESYCYFCPFNKKCKKDWNEVKTYEERLAENKKDK